MKIDDKESVEDVVARLSTDPRVAHVQPNYKYSYKSTNDTYFSSQWSLDQISDMDIDGVFVLTSTSDVPVVF